MQKYVAYYRVSTKEQGKSGLGLEAQRRDINLFVQNSPVGTQIIAEHTDIHSGTVSTREALTAAIVQCKEEGATLLVAKLDRLSRKVSFIATLMEDKKLNFKVAAMPHADKFQLHIYAALAEQERGFISLRTKAALAEKKTAGARLGGLRDKTNARNKARSNQASEAAARIWPIIKPMIESKMSLRSIAKTLNRMNIKTTSGATYYAQTVKNIAERCSS